jgi:hypothetical protein
MGYFLESANKSCIVDGVGNNLQLLQGCLKNYHKDVQVKKKKKKEKLSNENHTSVWIHLHDQSRYLLKFVTKFIS